MAQKLGYFEEAGLDVAIQTPSDPAAPIKQVAAGRTDLAISYEPEVLLAHEQGLDVVAVGALVNRPLTSMIWLKKSGIKGVGGLRGKTIATAGIPYQDAYLKTILARAKLSPSDVKTVNVGFGLLPALLGGQAQAMLGGFSNVEGVDLRLRGKDPVVTPVDKLGVPDLRRAGPGRPAQAARRRPAGDPPLPRRPRPRHRGRGEEPAGGDQSAAGSEPRPRPEADQGRGGGDPAAAQPGAERAALRLHGRRPSGAKFIAWMRDNGLISGAAGDRRACSATTTCRARSPNRAAAPSLEQARRSSPAAAPARRGGPGRSRSRAGAAPRAAASFSTPSAITSSESARAMPMIASTIAVRSCSTPSASTKERSIFSASKGKRLR